MNQLLEPNYLKFEKIYLQQFQLNYYYKLIVMDNQKCPICKKSPTEPINLKCDHHPCFSCAKEIISIQSESQIETKYKIVCPSCKKKTVTYDLRHLIISFTQQDEDLYVTSKYIAKKQEVKCSSRKGSLHNPFFQAQKLYQSSNPQQSINNSKRTSINSIAGTSEINIKCKLHSNSYLKYFCYDCHSSKSNPSILCTQCAKSHNSHHPKHKITSIKQAAQKIVTANKKKKQGLTKKIEEITNSVQFWTFNKQGLLHDYQKLEKEINEQFTKLYKFLQNKHEEIKISLKNQFQKGCQIVFEQLNKTKLLKDTYMEISCMNLKDLETHYLFYSNMENLQTHMNSLVNKKLPALPTFANKIFQVYSAISQKITLESPQQSSSLGMPNSSLNSTCSKKQPLNNQFSLNFLNNYQNTPQQKMNSHRQFVQKQQVYHSRNQSGHGTIVLGEHRNRRNSNLQGQAVRIAKQNQKSTTPRNNMTLNFQKILF